MENGLISTRFDCKCGNSMDQNIENETYSRGRRINGQKCNVKHSFYKNSFIYKKKMQSQQESSTVLKSESLNLLR